MALQAIPTSFAPRLTPDAPRRPQRSFAGVFGLIAYSIFVVVFIFAIGVFSYERVLVSMQAAKEKELAQTTAKIDQATIDTFIRLKNRLDMSQTLLKNHVVLSDFFSSFGEILPSGVRFTALHLAVDTNNAVALEGEGVAKSFNTLAATSAALATDNRIKDLIFSNIQINGDNSVRFSISASLNMKSVTASAP